MNISRLKHADRLWETTMESPFGKISLYAAPEGIIRIVLPNESRLDIWALIQKNTSAKTRQTVTVEEMSSSDSEAIQHLARAVQQLDEYFDQKRDVFDLDLVFFGAESFRERGQIELASIPYGETITYRELAHRLGNEAAARAAGSVCSSNPFPIILPCHRVVPSTGGLGHYRGGVPMKDALLSFERDSAVHQLS